MLFAEQKINTGYSYKVEDVFGTIEFTAPVQLEGGLLDDLVVLLLRQNLKAQTIAGDVSTVVGPISYVFNKRPTWEDIDPNEEDEPPCANIPTSTLKRAGAFIATISLKMPIINWLAKFVAAFRAAYKNLSK